MFKVSSAHVAAVQRTPGHQQAIAGSVGCLSQGKCQLRRKLTLNCAVQQGGVDPLPPIRRRPAIGRLVTGTATPILEATGAVKDQLSGLLGERRGVGGLWRGGMPASREGRRVPFHLIGASDFSGETI